MPYKKSMFCFIFFVYTGHALATDVAATSVTATSVAANKLSNIHDKNKTSQQKINQSEAIRLESIQTYLANERQALLFEKYNEQLAIMVTSQEEEISQLSAQIDSIAQTEQSVLPMLADMISNLDTFIAQDLPFLVPQRQQRVARLRTIANRADISTAEKYRQILDAYMLELSYGRSLETYQGALLGQQGLASEQTDRKKVDYFRFGRMSLYYQTLDGRSGGLWLPKEQTWQPLTQSQLVKLKQAILVSNKLKAPQLLTLPLPPMELN